ncbi:dienelactone hydrolase family protein [Actinomadura hibisca]|uniref:dienelactone hydrolase family protein n=1 Tax=Actinomadura hibisca TaxID=68565 RepID=UPI00083383BD|nr:dienelactone hydrolase family protein [Actinomadura hibisca]
MPDWTTIETTDGPMRAYTARPEAPPNRAVIVLQEAFGVNAHIQDIAERFAARGYLALAPDLFHRTGPATFDYNQHPEAMRLISALGPNEITTDIQAALTHLTTTEATPTNRTAITGFCFGGRATFTAATTIPNLAATVVFYGPGIATGPHAVLDRAKSINAPILLHVGAEDPTIPTDQVQAIDNALRTSNADFEQHIYPNAGHAFACDARPNMHHPEAAAKAWQRTHTFLARHLPARP